MRTTDTRVAGLVVYLVGEGLVVLDDGAGTVRLTESGARNLLYRVSPYAGEPREPVKNIGPARRRTAATVVFRAPKWQ